MTEGDVGTEPCTKSDWDGERIGEPCDQCGHTNVVHPGIHNPSLDECVLCVLIETSRHDQSERSDDSVR